MGDTSNIIEDITISRVYRKIQKIKFNKIYLEYNEKINISTGWITQFELIHWEN